MIGQRSREFCVRVEISELCSKRSPPLGAANRPAAAPHEQQGSRCLHQEDLSVAPCVFSLSNRILLYFVAQLCCLPRHATDASAVSRALSGYLAHWSCVLVPYTVGIAVMCAMQSLQALSCSCTSRHMIDLMQLIDSTHGIKVTWRLIDASKEVFYFLPGVL